MITRFIFCILILPCSVYAQRQAIFFREDKLINDNQKISSLKIKSIFINKPIKGADTTKDNIIGGRIKYSFDKNGNVIEQLIYCDPGFGNYKCNKTKFRYEYNFNNDVINRIEYNRFCLAIKSGCSTIDYVYDDKNRKTFVSVKNLNEHGESFNTLKYDSNNNIVLDSTYFAYTDGNKALPKEGYWRRTQYIYDSHGDLILMIMKTPESYSKKKYILDSNEKVTSIAYSSSIEDTAWSVQYEFSNDNLGRLETRMTYDHSETWKDVYEYEGNSSFLIKITRYNKSLYFDTEFKQVYVESYGYNSLGLVETIKVNHSGEKISSVTRITYEYY